MKLHPTLYGLRDAFRNYCTQYAPDIMAFCSDSLLQDHAERPLSAQSLEVCQKLLKQPPGACATTQSLLDAVRSATPHVCWRRSYTEKDAGIDAFYLSNYGWFNLIAPSGPFVSDTLRLSVGYWEKGLFYPRHWHEPEEIYLTIAGSATFLSDGRDPIDAGAGATICHYSNQPHAADFSNAPLLAAAFWRGRELEAKPIL